MRIFYGLVLAFGLSQNAFATTVLALSEPDLARGVDAVVFGHVLSVRSVTDGDRAFTEASVEVIAAARGLEPTSVITLQVPGGMTRSGLMQHVSGAPRLEPGQLWVGFLVATQGHYVPYGLSYGLLPVTRGGDGVYRASRQAPGLSLVAPDPAVLARIDAEPVETLLARVRGYYELGVPSGDGGVKR